MSDTGSEPATDEAATDAEPSPAGPVGLVLAAGSGTRLGHGPKALLPIRGTILVEHTARALLDGGCIEVVVVTGAGTDQVDSALAGMDGLRCVHNAHWREGMGGSLRLGLETIGPGHDVLVYPVDRPGLGAEEVSRVLAAHRAGEITAAAHRTGTGQLRRGHPVLLDARWTVPASAAARADVGARDLLRAQREIVQLVDCSDLDDGGDLDSAADLWRLEIQAEPRAWHPRKAGETQ